MAAAVITGTYPFKTHWYDSIELINIPPFMRCIAAVYHLHITVDIVQNTLWFAIAILILFSPNNLSKSFIRLGPSAYQPIFWCDMLWSHSTTDCHCRLRPLTRMSGTNNGWRQMANVTATVVHVVWICYHHECYAMYLNYSCGPNHEAGTLSHKFTFLIRIHPVALFAFICSYFHWHRNTSVSY